MLSRRSFLIALAATAATIAPSRAIGTFGAAGLWEAMAKGVSIDEGRGASVRLLVAPGCDHAGSMWEASRGVLDRLRLHWMPVYEGVDIHRARVASCLTEGSTDAVRRMMQLEADAGAVDAQGLAEADALEALYQEELARLLWESTGRTPAMPSLVFRTSRDRCKVIRGSIPAARFAEVIDEAWSPSSQY